MKYNVDEMEKVIVAASVYSKEKSDEHGEVFTPASLINEMLDQIPAEYFSDKTKTFFDPCAGLGQFPIQIIKRLMSGLETIIPDNDERYKWIVENQLFMSELQDSSVDFIQQTLNPHNDLKLNIHHGNTLEMPADYFDKVKTKKPQQPFFAF